MGGIERTKEPLVPVAPCSSCEAPLKLDAPLRRARGTARRRRRRSPIGRRLCRPIRIPATSDRSGPMPCRVDTTTASTTGGSTVQVQVLPSHKSRHTFSPPAATCQSRARLKREAVVREAARFRLRRAPESATNSEAGAPLLGASMAAASSGWAEVLGAASTQDLGARLAPRPPPCCRPAVNVPRSHGFRWHAG